MFWLTKNYTGVEDQTRLNILFQRKRGEFNVDYKKWCAQFGGGGASKPPNLGGSLLQQACFHTVLLKSKKKESK